VFGEQGFLDREVHKVGIHFTESARKVITLDAIWARVRFRIKAAESVDKSGDKGSEGDKGRDGK
jgi:hypothetical protein